MSTASDPTRQLLARLEALPFSRWHRKLAAVAFFGVLFDAADFALFGAALPAIAGEFHWSPVQSGLLATLGLVGASMGALCWGTISDYIGRRPAFQATIALFAAFTGLIALSWNMASLATFRFLANFGLGGEVPVVNTLMTEFMPGRLRGRVTGTVQAAFPLGLVLAAGLALLILPALGWRVLFALGVVPALLLVFVRRTTRESVRYLVSKNRWEEAASTVTRIERLASPGGAGRRASQSAAVTLPEPAGQAAAAGRTAAKVTVWYLLTQGRARRTILLWIVSFCYFWSSNGILFMLPTVLTQRGFPLSQAISLVLVQAVAGTFGYVACSFLIDRYGRRPVLFLYFLVGAAFHLAFALSTGLWMYGAIALVGWVNPGVMGANSVYAAELYPTHLRATAVGWFFGIGRIGSFLAPVAVGVMLAAALGEFVLYTFALTFLVAAVAVWSVGIETRGRVLESITGLEMSAVRGASGTAHPRARQTARIPRESG